MSYSMSVAGIQTLGLPNVRLAMREGCSARHTMDVGGVV